MRIILFLTIAAFISGCFPEDQKRAVKAVQDMFHAERVSAGSGTMIHSTHGQVDYKSLKLESGVVLNDSSVTDINITTIGTLLFYQNLAPATLKGKDAIKIVLKRNIEGNMREVEALYFIDTLKLVDSLVVLYDKFCKNFVAGSYLEAYSQFELSLHQAMPFDTFNVALADLDSRYGPVKQYVITEFETWQGERVVEGVRMEGIRFSADLTRDSLVTRMHAIYSIHPNDKGIMAFWTKQYHRKKTTI